MSAEDVVAVEGRPATKGSAPKEWWGVPLTRKERSIWAVGYNTAKSETRTTLTASQARYERLRGMVEGLALECHKLVIRIGNIDADGGSAGKQGLRDAESDLEELYEKLILLADGGEANDNEVEG